MVFKIVVHKAEEGGYWAEIPNLPGCFTQGETLDEIRINAREAIDAYLGENENPEIPEGAQILEIAV
jgi:predicted RNase H-like HicB family nuclease